MKNDRHDAVLDHLAELNVAQGLEAWAADLSRRFSAIGSMMVYKDVTKAIRSMLITKM